MRGALCLFKTCLALSKVKKGKKESQDPFSSLGHSRHCELRARMEGVKAVPIFTVDVLLNIWRKGPKVKITFLSRCRSDTQKIRRSGKAEDVNYANIYCRCAPDYYGEKSILRRLGKGN